jgi:hypothetical protein
MAKAPTPPAETSPPSPSELSAEIQRQLDAFKAELASKAGGFEARLSTVASSLTTLEQAVAKLELQRAELDQLSKEIRSMIVSRGREVGHEEAAEILAGDPSRRFTVMAPYPTLGLRPGDAIDPRQRFEHPARDLPHHIRSGLRVAPAPAA